MAGVRVLGIRMHRSPVLTLGALASFVLSACSSVALAGSAQTEQTPASATPTSAAAVEESATPDATESQLPYEDRWKAWPVLPEGVSEELKRIYKIGIENGNDPHAFSILGDCQSLPEAFLAPYDADAQLVAVLPANLQETVRNFAGSFARYSPTVKDGTTSGALLWEQWNDNEEGYCEANETPLDCELRVHKPSIVLVHIGTHWETRNTQYLTRIIETILAHGAVPVLATKADNRELDERVNRDIATLAEEYGLPVWNFWATVHHLPYDGLYPNSTWELSEEAQVIHRESALEALDQVWRALNN